MKQNDLYTSRHLAESRYKSRRGFTLIEVVVALGVLGIALTAVAALWIPTVKRASMMINKGDLQNAMGSVNTQINTTSFEEVLRKTQNEEVIELDGGIRARLEPSKIKTVNGVRAEEFEGMYFGIDVTLERREERFKYTAIKNR